MGNKKVVEMLNKYFASFFTVEDTHSKPELRQSCDWFLFWIAAIEAVKKAHREELERLRSTQNISNNSDLERLRKQHQEELESLQRELQVLSEQYSHKCLEINYQMKETQMRERDLSRSQRENEELLRQNQELNGQLSEEIARIRALVTGKNHDNIGNLPVTGDRDTCELE
eukprot:g46395.t1